MTKTTIPPRQMPTAAWLARVALVVLTAVTVVAPHAANAQRRRRFRRLAARRCRLPAENIPAPQAAETKQAWQSLFDGASLKGWKSTNFGGEGEVSVVNGTIVLPPGTPLTGVTYNGGELPKTDFEVELEAQRQEGVDFFCGLTFPVADSYCSFIVAGWAGTVVGLSSIDGFDASENETAEFKEFDDNRWYRIRVRVTPSRIRAWIDDEKLVDLDIRDRKISTRVEVDLSQPLGVSAYQTKAALRNIRIRRLNSAEMDPQ